jgi:hypothetical protein
MILKFTSVAKNLWATKILSNPINMFGNIVLGIVNDVKNSDHSHK